MKNLLVVDDSKAVHAFVTELLRQTDYTLDHAYNGQEGLQKIELQSYDAVLLDWEMPILTGPEVLNELKSKGVKIPVVMMTTRNSPEDIMKMLEAGASEYIMKPFTQDILLEKMAEVAKTKG